MADNGKKEFPIDGFEVDVTSKVGRKIYCYIKNVRGVTKYVKRKMNKRFRKRNKPKL
jgi:hypothetical protein